MFSFCSSPAAKYVSKGAMTLQLNGVAADLGWKERERQTPKLSELEEVLVL